MNKKELTEADIRTKFITPALVAPGGRWDLMTQLREEVYFTKGRVIVRGKTVKRLGENAALLPTHCHQPHRRSHRPRGESHSTGHGDWHREDIHGFSDHLAALEVGR